MTIETIVRKDCSIETDVIGRDHRNCCASVAVLDGGNSLILYIYIYTSAHQLFPSEMIKHCGKSTASSTTNGLI